MNSDDLEAQGLGPWLTFNMDSKNELLSSVPEAPGCYAIRKSHLFSRYSGESDIVYIGSAEGGLRKRLRSYFRPGSSQATSQRVNAEMEAYSDLQLGFKAFYDGENVRAQERDWLMTYKGEHKELPPLNRAMPGEQENE